MPLLLLVKPELYSISMSMLLIPGVPSGIILSKEAAGNPLPPPHIPSPPAQASSGFTVSIDLLFAI